MCKKFICKFEQFAMVLLMGLLSCAPSYNSEDAIARFDNVIPKPLSSVSSGKIFVITGQTKTLVKGDASDKLANVAEQYVSALGTQPWTQGPVEEDAIHLKLVESDRLGDEGYRLRIDEENIQIEAQQPAGIFYALQTIRQLLVKTEDGAYVMATGMIEDRPRYSWRGSMLDVSRHFFDVQEVKRYIDLLALYKMNVLHLHLSDDQGWRIEIKSWPNLTAIGSTTEVGGGKGGFYTQEEFSHIISYAQDRFTTIVPEIDLPGHTNAALASYPELNCDNKAPDLYTGINVGFSSLCASKEITYQFVRDVVNEIAAISPGPYFHVGGDEARSTPKADYIQFINRFHEIAVNANKTMVAWEEAAQADIDSNTIVQYWHSPAYAQLAAKKGAKVIFSPAPKVYLDMKYDSLTSLGLNWAGYIDVSTAYNWNPETLVDSLDDNNILGVEAPIWSETLENIKDVEYMMFPRIVAVAEVAWTSGDHRQWNDFARRLGNQSDYLKSNDINYYPSPEIQWKK